MKNIYSIQRWDVVLANNSRVPLIYIEPDLKLIEQLEKNNWLVLCSISGTNSDYDNHLISGKVNISGLVPNCRPNFYSATGLYTIALDSAWLGYVKDRGFVNIY